MLFISMFFMLIPNLFLFVQRNNSNFSPASTPVFRVDYPSPTTDKPQSKLWFMDGCWWAILPRSAGPSLWQRTNNGWKEYTEVCSALTGVPGRADVWANKHVITAVGVNKSSLTIFRLEKKTLATQLHWNAYVLAVLNPPFDTDEIETATVAQDHTGIWWVAAVASAKVCVWSSSADGKQWSKPGVLADGIAKDDICAVALVPEGIGFIWSDQIHESVNIRVHEDGRQVNDWNKTATIDSGNHTSDDHLNTALSSNGTLWLVSKNSLDETGKPQLSLHVRSAKGTWKNFPYAVLESDRKPSRPRIITTENTSVILAGHTIYNAKDSRLGEIVFGQVDTTQNGLLRNLTTVISPDTTGRVKGNRINDVTGPKKPFPLNAPWIILASDQEGRVYEADLKKLIISSNK